MSITSLPLFGYHPLIQSFTILLLLQAIVVLQRTTPQQGERKKQAFSAHQWLNLLLVLPLFTAGASIMWYLHDQPGSGHFLSYHGILGTFVVVAAWIQAALGAASVWWKGKLVGGEAKGKALWKWHRLSGYVVVSLFLITAALGVLETTWGWGKSGVLQKTGVAVALPLVGFALLIRVQRSKLPKL
uniref:Cytochrome b561 domain-containing protein n=2 Tax=Kalmanozyma brasiliensis (strain GHG001) TaxID=1365824 RepID=V5EPS9_KALBG